MNPNLIEPFNRWKEEQVAELDLNDNDLYILFLEDQLDELVQAAEEFARLSRMDRPKTLAAWQALDRLDEILRVKP